MTTLHHRGHRGQEETFFRGGELIGVVVLSIALLAGAVQLQAARERRYPPPGTDEAAMYLQSGTAVRRLTGAYTPLAADLYWIRAIQYYGSTKRRLEGVLSPDPPPMLAAPTSNEFQLLYPMLDVATSLDPRFTIAYRFGAVFLAEAYPGRPSPPHLAHP